MESYDGADAIEGTWREGLRPDPLLTVSQWSDRYRVLSQRASSEPGRCAPSGRRTSRRSWTASRRHRLCIASR